MPGVTTSYITQVPVIEKDIPIPNYRRSAYAVNWRALEIGDSVFLAGYRQGRPQEGLRNLNMGAIRSAVKDYALVARADQKDGVLGIRIWRVA